MSQNAILFIPDISGFTEFVHHTAINHSKHIISELLELPIDANNMGLELVEIEGDALFLYKLEDKIDTKVLENQIESMYLAFHTHLKRYEYQRICHCGACSSAYNLKIKFVSILNKNCLLLLAIRTMEIYFRYHSSGLWN